MKRRTQVYGFFLAILIVTSIIVLPVIANGDNNEIGVEGLVIFLSPLSGTNKPGDLHTLTAKVLDANGIPVQGKFVSFEVTEGPGNGITGSGLTDVNGEVLFVYTGNTEGTDSISAYVVDDAGSTIESNKVTKIWEMDNQVPTPEFPKIAIPVGLLLGVAFIITSFISKKN